MDNKPNYIGGKFKVITGKYDDMYAISLCLEDLQKIATESKNGKHYAKIKVTKKKEVDQWGNTHTMVEDTWKPEKREEEREEPINPSDVPF